MHRFHRGPTVLSLLVALLLVGVAGAAEPKMVCFLVQPNAYLDDHAAEVAQIYDGFFFSANTWEDAAQRLTAPQLSDENRAWLAKARTNLASLRKAGATENFLTVSFASNGEWPSKSVLLDPERVASMAARFGALAKLAKESGFRGLCLDVEYCYARCSLRHANFTYDDYTAGDLVAASRREGRACMAAILEAFPEAVIWTLPGSLRGEPIQEGFLKGMLEEMAQCDAVGGLHLGLEYTYWLHDPVTTLAATRYQDGEVANWEDPLVTDYWKRRCTTAPGVWPLNMIEGGPDYPVQAWTKEMAELTEQMTLLRSVAKRYLWSYTGVPVWYLYSPELKEKYGLAPQDLKRPDVDLRLWHELLRAKPTVAADSPWKPLVDKIHQYDAGTLNAEELCDAFGTPGHWWVLGPVGNPHSQRQFAALESLGQPIRSQDVYQGRSTAVRWFDFANLDPRGTVSGRFVFQWRDTDDAAAHFVSFVHAPKRVEGFLHFGWDDGLVVRLGDQVVFDRGDYPPKGKGFLYRDKYQYETKVPITLEPGGTRLSVLSLNGRGNWAFALRLTDQNDLPLEGVQFRRE